MAWYLYRLGRWSFRHRRVVAAGWLLAFVAAVVGAATLSGKTEDSFDLPGLESTDAFALVEDRTPDAAPDGATARVVFRAPEGEQVTSAENKAAVAASLASLDSEHLTSATDPFTTGTVSEDGTTAYSVVRYDVAGIELAAADTENLEVAGDPAKNAGLRVAIGGDALQEIPEQGAAELIGLGLAAIVLMLTFGSLVAAGMPLLTAIVGTGIGVMGITAATGFMSLGSTTPILASMLGLAVAIDYALFIVSRYRHEAANGRDLEDAAGRAVGTAGSAVVFAGLTVVIALAGLSVVGISFLTEMGLAAVVTVAMSVLIALTLLPALMGFAGHRILSSRFGFLRRRDPELRRGGKPTRGRRWVDFVTTHKLATMGLGLLIAAIAAIPVGSMQLALPDDSTAKAGSGQRDAYDMISDSFGPGANGPLSVIVDVENAHDPDAAVAAVTKSVAAVEKDVAAVIPATPQAPPASAPAAQVQAHEQQQGMYEQQLAEAKYAVITVVPKSGPSEAATADLVKNLRADLRIVDAETAAESYVTGQTAVSVDVSDELASAFPAYLALVVGLAFLLLMLVFRSILVPLKAVAGFLLTIGISLGATVAVFQWGWGLELLGQDVTSPLIAMLPILMVGILFGLAMDYEVFLVSRMREEFVHGREALPAVVEGFSHGARVVTAAATIMIGVFLGFATSGDLMIVTIAFGLAVGILADAFLVRMTLVPAFMALVGKHMWWLPRWLDKLLPNLDIEGEGLQRRLRDQREAAVVESASESKTKETVGV